MTRGHGTERAFTHDNFPERSRASFHCVCCGEELFDQAHKFDSGTGWPSFYQPAVEGAAVETQRGPGLVHAPHRGPL